MNAQGIKNQDHFNWLICNENYAAQEKLDGMRSIIFITKAGLRIFSRSAGVDDPSRPLEKTSALPHLASLRFPHLVNTILDAEILAPGVDAAHLSGAIHSNGVGKTNGLVKIFVFDVLRYRGEDQSYKTLQQRIEVLDILNGALQSPYIIFLPWAFTAKEKRDLYETVLSRGGEGIMLKRLNAFYIQGGRPANNWLKAKKSTSFDCVVMGFTKGKGKYNTCIGALVFGQYVDGTLTELGQASGMSDAERNKMSAHPDEFIGKVVTIKGMERHKSGAIRHPQYGGMRYDKDRHQCRWYPNEQ
jgi:ATP-dependent DNA ligase